ncbi:putative DNA-binding domain-containing protein [Sphingomonas sp. CJ20]
MHQAVAFGGEGAAVAQALFVGTGRLSAAGGLAIYQRGYFLRIAACMRAQFPALTHALGPALFDDFVADYIHDHPPERHTLHDLGRRFAHWMEVNRPDHERREPWVDFMIDLARFEYSVFTMFDAEGKEGQALATPDTPDAALRLQPAFALGSYAFPVADYYHAVRRGEAPTVPQGASTHVALVRTDYVIRSALLSETQRAFLAEMQAGASVATALALVTAQFHLAPDEVLRSWRHPQGSRSRWIAMGFFVAA